MRKFSRMNRLLLGSLALGAVTAGYGATQWNEMDLPEHTYVDAQSEYQEGVYEIPVPAYSALEFQLHINEGEGIVYEWTAEGGEPGMLTTEFHGHTEPVDGQGDLMFYKIHSENQESGMLTAPFTAIHGWYLNNQGEEDVTVTLKVAGFYSVVDNGL